MKKVSALFVLYLVVFFACKHDPFVLPDNPDQDNPVIVTPCSPDSVYFENQILPILISNCTQSGCHNDADRADGVVLISYAQLTATVDKVKNPNPTKNKLLGVINETKPDKRMPRPPAPPLSTAQISLIATWVQQGARNNRCENVPTPCDTISPVTYSGFVKPLLTQHCTDCHGSQGGVSLRNYDDVRIWASGGQLYASLTRTLNPMPKYGERLPDCDLRKLKRWIDAGAPNN